MPVTDFPRNLRKPLLELLAAGGSVARDGNRVLIDGPPALSNVLRAHAEELAQHVVPSVGAEETELVRSLLADAGVTVAYITSPGEARRAVAEICASSTDVIGLDFETEVLPAFRQPIPVKFNKDGNLAIRQPRDGAAGAALDPYRSKVRLVQAWAGGEHCYVFDMRSVAWADIAPLFALPLAIFNAVFEVKRLIHEAKIEPTGRIYDVMTAIWLTDGRRPSLGEAVAINYGLNLPKELGASDWSSDTLRPNSSNTPPWMPCCVASSGIRSRMRSSTTSISSAKRWPMRLSRPSRAWSCTVCQSMPLHIECRSRTGVLN